jgi:hypothetical protein
MLTQISTCLALLGSFATKVGVLCTDKGWRQVPTYEKLPICEIKIQSK